jgi:protein-S-isoprenylcysteine O-methyltransferase Ste14
VLRVLSETFARQGSWLFRWRGYLPLLLAPILVVAILRSAGPSGGAVPDGLAGLLCAVAVVAGLLIRAYTVGHAPPGTSGANTQSQVATTLNVTGSYSMVRHPLYLGNALMWLGVALFTGSLVAVALLMLIFWIYYERIMMAEEAFLDQEFGETFRAWAARTPAFLPNPRLWTPPAAPFNWRNVVRREYSSTYWVVLILLMLALLSGSAAVGYVRMTPVWLAAVAIATCLYLGTMFVKRRTHALDVDR